jgi:hypothetical protein
MQRTRDGQARVRYSVVGRSGGRVTSCAVCIMHKKMRSTGFLVEPQNQGRQVSLFGPQIRQLWFVDLDIKITTSVFWFGPQNQAVFCLLVAPQNRWREVVTGHTSRSSGLLRVESSWTRFPSLASRLMEPRLRVVYVTSS